MFPTDKQILDDASWLKKTSKVSPKKAGSVLWHYTSFEALASIFKNAELWASAILHMNDSSELIDTVKEAKKMLKKKGFDKPIAKLDELIGKRMFVSCFAHALPDSLEQWRGYSSDQAGVAIGFDVGKLKELANRLELELLECDYSKKWKKQFRIIVEDLEHFRRLAEMERQGLPTRGLPPGMTLEAYQKTNIKRVQAAAQYAQAEETFSVYPVPVLAKAKHPAFKHEHEWRLVRHDVRNGFDLDEVYFRMKGSMPVPFIKIPLGEKGKEHPMPEGMVKAIVIGPGTHKERTWDAISRLLDRYQTRVCVSQIPFRWNS